MRITNQKLEQAAEECRARAIGTRDALFDTLADLFDALRAERECQAEMEAHGARGPAGFPEPDTDLEGQS